MLFNIPNIVIVFMALGSLILFLIAVVWGNLQYNVKARKNGENELKQYRLLLFNYLSSSFVVSVSFGLVSFIDSESILGFFIIIIISSAFLMGGLYATARRMRSIALNERNEK